MRRDEAQAHPIGTGCLLDDWTKSARKQTRSIIPTVHIFTLHELHINYMIIFRNAQDQIIAHLERSV